MAKITFLRHAQSTANKDGIFAGRLDCSITEEGFKEAQKLFPNEKFNIIYCSPLKRTSQTLHAFLPNTTPIIDERITEVDVGIWQGKLKSSLENDLINQFLLGNYLPEGAESINNTDERVKSFITDIFNKYSENDNILVVTHNGAIRSVKRLFPDKVDALMSKNLEFFSIDTKDYIKFEESQNNPNSKKHSFKFASDDNKEFTL